MAGGAVEQPVRVLRQVRLQRRPLSRAVVLKVRHQVRLVLRRAEHGVDLGRRALRRYPFFHSVLEKESVDVPTPTPHIFFFAIAICARRPPQ